MCGGFPRRKDVIEFTILDFPVCDSFSHSPLSQHPKVLMHLHLPIVVPVFMFILSMRYCI